MNDSQRLTRANATANWKTIIAINYQSDEISHRDFHGQHWKPSTNQTANTTTTEAAPTKLFESSEGENPPQRQNTWSKNGYRSHNPGNCSYRRITTEASKSQLADKTGTLISKAETKGIRNNSEQIFWIVRARESDLKKSLKCSVHASEQIYRTSSTDNSNGRSEKNVTSAENDNMTDINSFHKQTSQKKDQNARQKPETLSWSQTKTAGSLWNFKKVRDNFLRGQPDGAG